MVDEGHAAEDTHQLEVVEGAEEVGLAHEALLTLGAERGVGFDGGHLLQGEVAALHTLEFGAVIVEKNGVVGIYLEVFKVVEVAAVGQVLAAFERVVGRHVAQIPFGEISVVELPSHGHIAGVDVLDAHRAFGIEVVEAYAARILFFEPVVAPGKRDGGGAKRHEYVFADSFH